MNIIKGVSLFFFMIFTRDTICIRERERERLSKIGHEASSIRNSTWKKKLLLVSEDQDICMGLELVISCFVKVLGVDYLIYI